MYYREHQIDKLEHLPQRSQSFRDWDYYYSSWHSENNNLGKVNPASLVGKSLRYITRRYLHRMPEHRRSIINLLDLIGIQHWQVDLNSWRWRSQEYFIDVDNIVKRNPNYKHWKRHYRNKGIRKPRKERMREYYEKRAKLRKRRRDSLKAQAIHTEQLVDWLYYQRKREAKALEKQKLIQHGFDPELSFRNHK